MDSEGFFCYSGSEHNIYFILGLPQSHWCWHCLAHKDCTHQVLSSAWVIISQHYLLSQQYYVCSTNSFGGNTVKYRFWTAGLFNPVCKINNVNYCMSSLYRLWIIRERAIFYSSLFHYIELLWLWFLTFLFCLASKTQCYHQRYSNEEDSQTNTNCSCDYFPTDCTSY